MTTDTMCCDFCGLELLEKIYRVAYFGRDSWEKSEYTACQACAHKSTTWPPPAAEAATEESGKPHS